MDLASGDRRVENAGGDEVRPGPHDMPVVVVQHVERARRQLMDGAGVEIPDRPAPTKAQKTAAWNRENGLCWKCGKPIARDGLDVEWDHTTPRGLSGDDSADNLAREAAFGPIAYDDPCWNAQRELERRAAQ